MIRFVTSNMGKFKEAERILSGVGLDVEMLSIEYPEVQGDSLKEVVLFGLNWLRQKVEGNVLIEDSGLFIESLGGFPGVFSSYVFQTIGLDGILKLLESEASRAHFESCIGLLDGDKAMTFSGRCEGTTSEQIRGTRGFGYDPIFVPKGGSRTFGEMETDEKNRISHRGEAFEKLVNFLQSR
ncbi:MAG: XTP/dITP diphosphatase [Thermoplasmata archaeon]